MSYFGLMTGAVILLFLIAPEGLGKNFAEVVHAYNQKLLELRQEQPK